MSWYHLQTQQNTAQTSRIVKAMYFDARRRDFYFQDILVDNAQYHGSISRNRIVEVLHNMRTGKVTLRTASYRYIDFDARLPKNRALFDALKLVTHDWQVVDALSIAGNLLLEMPKTALVGSRSAR